LIAKHRSLVTWELRDFPDQSNNTVSGFLALIAIARGVLKVKDRRFSRQRITTYAMRGKPFLAIISAKQRL
jgi:hypothetical protein